VIGVEAGDQDSGLRLAELVAAFSLATGLGMGQPMEHVLRSWLIAVRLGDRMDLGSEARVSLYYVMVLAWAAVWPIPRKWRPGSAMTSPSGATVIVSISLGCP
jgi:hypothetical protein